MSRRCCRSCCNSPRRCGCSGFGNGFGCGGFGNGFGCGGFGNGFGCGGFGFLPLLLLFGCW